MRVAVTFNSKMISNVKDVTLIVRRQLAARLAIATGDMDINVGVVHYNVIMDSQNSVNPVQSAPIERIAITRSPPLTDI